MTALQGQAPWRGGNRQRGGGRQGRECPPTEHRLVEKEPSSVRRAFVKQQGRDTHDTVADAVLNMVDNGGFTIYDTHRAHKILLKKIPRYLYSIALVVFLSDFI